MANPHIEIQIQLEANLSLRTNKKAQKTHGISINLPPRALDSNEIVAKMASHAIFQYNVLAIDDPHNTWTNMIVKTNIPRLLGSSDDKEKIGAARPEGPPRRSKGQESKRPMKIHTPVEPTMHRSIASVQLSREVVFWRNVKKLQSPVKPTLILHTPVDCIG